MESVKHESKYITVDGVQVYVMAKLIGDHFRYFVKNYEFPFCSIDHPDDDGNFLARTFRGIRKFPEKEFSHKTGCGFRRPQ